MTHSNMASIVLLGGLLGVTAVTYGRMTGFDPFSVWSIGEGWISRFLFTVYFVSCLYWCSELARGLGFTSEYSRERLGVFCILFVVGLAAVVSCAALVVGSQAEVGRWIRIVGAPLIGSVGTIALIAHRSIAIRRGDRSCRATHPGLAVVAAGAVMGLGTVLYIAKSLTQSGSQVALQLSLVAAIIVLPATLLLTGVQPVRDAPATRETFAMRLVCLVGSVAIAGVASML